MAECTSQAVVESVKACAGAINKPGIRRRYYGIPLAEISVWPAIKRYGDAKNPPVAAKDAQEYTGDYTLAPEKKWRTFDAETIKLSHETQGEKVSGKTVKNLMEVTHKGTKAANLAMASAINNEPMIFLVQDIDSKRFHVIGCEEYGGCDVATSSTNGGGAADTNTLTINISADDLVVLPYYNGKIETEDGDISGEDGSAVLGA